MVKTLSLELLKDYWLMHEESINLYSQLAHDVLAGKKVSTDFFSSLQLPDVPDNMALITMVGPLTKSDVCESKGSRTLSKEVQDAAANPSIDAIIVLSEGCPGGQCDGTEELANAINAAKYKKPVLSAISGMACSAAYWTVSQCSEAYAQSQTDMIGCIGVVARMRNPKKVDAENANIIDVYSDLSPDKNGEFKSPEAYKQQLLNPLAQIFHNAVLAGRGGKLKLSTENVLSGKTYLAQDATSYGLIDGVMPFNKIVARANFLSKQRKNK